MNWKILLIIVVLFVGALLAGRFLAPTGMQSGSLQLPATTVEATWCEPAAGACLTTLPDGTKVEMAIEPRDQIKPMRPLVATVTLPDGWVARALEATGLNMDMGINRFTFGPTADGKANSDFLLPICVLTKMEWQLTLSISDGSQVMKVPFNFVVER